MIDEEATPKDAHKLMKTVSLELDTDLRLHPQRLELGKAELLTDALTLPFTDIEKRLRKYLAGGSAQENEELRRSMKGYLARLNANPLIPLQFRLRVLRRFESELDLFDAEMTAALLNAHKIAVEMVQQAARSHPEYLPIVVDMVAHALELAEQVLSYGLERYRVPAVIATRQAFDLARLGLAVLPALPDSAAGEGVRLRQAVCNHELLRRLDFFAKPTSEQRLIRNELKQYTELLQPHYCRKGQPPPELAGRPFMVSHIARPGQVPEVVAKLPERFIGDAIVISLAPFLDKLGAAVKRVEALLASSTEQKRDLHTERALLATRTAGRAALEALQQQQRAVSRQECSVGTSVVLEWKAAKALVEAQSALVMRAHEYTPSERAKARAWSVVNVSENGACLERMSFEAPDFGVGALVGLNWLPHSDEPMLGFVRWFKQPKPGEQRMGVEFLREEARLLKGAVVGAGHEHQDRRSWPILVRRGTAPLAALIPDTNISRDLSFLLTDAGKSVYCKVKDVLEAGPNFCRCLIDRAQQPESRTFEVED